MAQPKQEAFCEEDFKKVYKALPTAQEFHRSNAFVRGILGPVGGGKTVACIMELYTRALEQKPHNGVRRSRWALIRNSYPELLSTTIKTFEDWIPRAVCPIRQSTPISGVLKVDLPDGTRVEAEFLFLALDIEDDVKKLKSLELTGAFINEASEIRESVLEMLTSRVDRYPAKNMGGTTWTGIVMDTNPPDTDHWWYRLAETEKPKGYRFWKQPPAMIRIENKEGDVHYVPNDGTHGIQRAENIENHNSGFDYYARMVPGKSEEWIKVYVLGQYGSIYTGKPVYAAYNDKVHCAKEELQPYRGLPLLLGWDFGLTPSCIIMQMSPKGQLRVLDELVSEDMGSDRFSRDVVKPFLTTEKYQGMHFACVGDPAGGARAQSNEVTCFQSLEQNGFPVVSAPTNDFIPRKESVDWFLSKLVDGEPGFVLSPTCEVLRRGFLGGYQFRKVRLSGSKDRFTETPEKNEFSHPHDALQYGCLHLRKASVSIGLGQFETGVGLAEKKNIRVKDFSAWS